MCMDRKKILEKIQWRPSGTTSQYIIKCLVTLAQKSSIKKKVRPLKAHLGRGTSVCGTSVCGERGSDNAPADVLTQLAACCGKTRRD